MEKVKIKRTIEIEKSDDHGVKYYCAGFVRHDSIYRTYILQSEDTIRSWKTLAGAKKYVAKHYPDAVVIEK